MYEKHLVILNEQIITTKVQSTTTRPHVHGHP